MLFEAEKVIEIKIDETTVIFTENLSHLITTFRIRPEKVSQSLFTNVLLYDFGETEVNENVLLESGTPHDVTRFDVPMNYFQRVHHFQRQQQVINFVNVDPLTQFHRKLNAVAEENDIETEQISDEGTDLQNGEQFVETKLNERVQ